MKKRLTQIFFLLALAPLFCGVSVFASASSAVKKKTDEPPKAETEALPQEALEFLSLGEYWGVRTDIDAAQGGSGERKILDLQYDWDSALSASKEEEAFSKAEKENNASHNPQ